MNAIVGIWIFGAVFAQMGAAELTVSVFYESLCPDSIEFIREQLHPTLKLFPKEVTLELVPFGKARIKTTPWKISCQHGSNECLGNALQACALARNPERDAQVDIVSCFMSRRSTPAAAEQCANDGYYNFTEVIDCAYNEEGRDLLNKHGERTWTKFKNGLSFVPTVLFNDEYSRKDHKDSLKNLKAVICRKLESPPTDVCGK